MSLELDNDAHEFSVRVKLEHEETLDCVGFHLGLFNEDSFVSLAFEKDFSMVSRAAQHSYLIWGRPFVVDGLFQITRVGLLL